MLELNPPHPPVVDSGRYSSRPLSDVAGASGRFENQEWNVPMRNSALCAALAVCAGIALLIQPVRAADHDKWIEVRSSNFIVVSNGSEGDARKVALQFEQIRRLFRDSLAYTRNHASPVITILAAKDENTLRELLPEFWGMKGGVHPAGAFLDGYDQFQVAMNLEAHGDNPYQTIYHEYYHSVTVPYFSFPVWLREGLAEFYGNTEIDQKNAKVGMANPALLGLLRRQPMIPLSALFAVSLGSPYYTEQGKINIFYAESWALVHYLLLGDQRSHLTEFANFLTALDQGKTPQQAVEAFGDLGKMQLGLQHYIQNTQFPIFIQAAPAEMAANDLRARVLSDAEADAYRGGSLVLHRQFKAAQPLLEEAVRLEPKSALAQQNLSLLQYAQGSDALASLSAAIALDPHNAYTRYLRARFTYDRSLGVPDARTEDVNTDLRQAIAANPDFAPPYALLALRLAINDPDLPEALSLAQKADALEPGRVNYQSILAQVLIRMRRYDEAEAIARHISQASEPARQKEADDLLRAVQQGRDLNAQRTQ